MGFSLQYKLFTKIDPTSDYYMRMCELHASIFTTQSSASITEELFWRKSYLLVLALENDKVVGYKLGYEERQGRFYSWLGGVYPEYRKKGIATKLLRLQHEWCKKQRYSVVRTQTKNRWRNMLLLNIKSGFDVIGTYTDDRGETKIILEKSL